MKMKLKDVACVVLAGVLVYSVVGIHKDLKEMKKEPVIHDTIRQVYEYTPQETQYDKERQERILEQQELDGIVSEEPAEIVLYDIPLDAETQCAISQICDEWEISDTLVYGIYAVETGNTFDPTIKNSSGSCIGLGQINARCHKARMEKLGVDDLTDPIQNTIVTVDILAELFEKYGDDIPYVLMCYNAGEGSAKRMRASGTIETRYSRAVMREQERLENGE